MIRDKIKLLLENINNFDIVSTAKEINNRFFGGKLDLNFPMRYSNTSRSLGKVKATKISNDIKITELNISSKWKMDYALFYKILIHELIHVKIIKERWQDIGGSHGVFFKQEMDRIRNMGQDVPLSEDLPDDVDFVSTDLKTPVYGIITNKKYIKFFKVHNPSDIEDAIRIAQHNLKGEPSATLEFIKTNIGLVSKYSVGREFKNVRLVNYILQNNDYDIFSKYVYDMKIVTKNK
jgi:hypothetical protein